MSWLGRAGGRGVRGAASGATPLRGSASTAGVRCFASVTRARLLSPNRVRPVPGARRVNMAIFGDFLLSLLGNGKLPVLRALLQRMRYEPFTDALFSRQMTIDNYRVCVFSGANEKHTHKKKKKKSTKKQIRIANGAMDGRRRRNWNCPTFARAKNVYNKKKRSVRDWRVYFFPAQ